MTFRRLLVPLDGSRLAESVLPVLAWFAPAFHAEVLLLHVLERKAPAQVHGDRHLRTLAEAEAYLEEIAGRLREQGLTVSYHTHEVAEGDVARSVVAHAEEHAVDLAVLCTHGSGGVQEMLFGSIAERVLSRGTRPVLLVRPHIGPAEPVPRRVLVPLDATSAAEIALAPAAEIAHLLGASLHLVMVVSAWEAMRRGGLPTFRTLPTATRAAIEIERQDAETYLEDAAAVLRGRSIEVTTEVRDGDTSAVLAQEAAEPGVGLVVIATRGRAGLQAILSGSTAVQFLDRTRAPVLLVRRAQS